MECLQYKHSTAQTSKIQEGREHMLAKLGNTFKSNERKMIHRTKYYCWSDETTLREKTRYDHAGWRGKHFMSLLKTSKYDFEKDHIK